MQRSTSGLRSAPPRAASCARLSQALRMMQRSSRRVGSGPVTSPLMATLRKVRPASGLRQR